MAAAGSAAPAHRPDTSFRDKLLDLSNADQLHVGRVARAQGLRGQVKLSTFDHDAPSIRKRVVLRLVRDDGTVVLAARILGVHRAPDGMVVDLEGVKDRNAAEGLLGLQVCVARADLPALPAEELWAADLPGMEVVDGSGARLGTVVRVEPGAAHDLLVMHNLHGEERVLPWVDAIVTRVDKAARRVVVSPIPGLIDDDGEEPVGDKG